MSDGTVWASGPLRGALGNKSPLVGVPGMPACLQHAWHCLHRLR